MPKPRNVANVSTAELYEVAASYSAQLTAQGIDHALIGGLVVGLYGRERATKDIDFLIASEDVDKITGSLLGGTVEAVRPDLAEDFDSYVFEADTEGD